MAIQLYVSSIPTTQLQAAAGLGPQRVLPSKCTAMGGRQCINRGEGPESRLRRSSGAAHTGRHRDPAMRGRSSGRRMWKVCATTAPMDMGDEPAVMAGGAERGVGVGQGQGAAARPTVGEWVARASQMAGVLWRFSRPHTVIGTTLSICAVSLLPIGGAVDLTTRAFVGLLQALVPALLMNVYIVGLNQIYDIEIDKVNKPELPLASGELDVGSATAIVAACAVASLGIGALVGSGALMWTLSLSLVLGTAYSVDVPFLRWKQYPLLAAGCILMIRAFVVQMGFFAHMQSFVMGRAGAPSRGLIFGTAFMCLFSIVIALCKDIPDLEGDRVYGIRSFTVRLGQEKVFWICVNILLAAYTSAVVMGASCTALWSRVAVCTSHAAAAAILWRRANQVELKSRASITSFYMFIWKLFYLEYLLLPLVR